MIALGIDPGSTHTGIACFDGQELIALASFRMAGGSWRGAQERVRPFLEELPRPDVVAVERTPPTARRDTRRKGSQANIGWVQGWTAGLLASLVDVEPLTPLPSEWRVAMQADGVRHRMTGLLRTPKRESADQIRDWWKMAACCWVGGRWPEAFERLVEGPRDRARKDSVPTHELAGVSDACEAAGIALWALTAAARFQAHPPGRRRSR